MMEKAILIPANPKLAYTGGGDEGSIIAHAVKIEEEGAVFWRLVAPGDWTAGEFPHEDIKRGYLYDVYEKRVTHVCEIAWIKPMSSLSYMKFRRYFLGELKSPKHFKEMAEFFYIVNLTSIFALLLRGKITEKDIEDLFFYRLMKNAKVVKRQGAFRRAGRLDLLVKDWCGNYVVYELKKGVASPKALAQVKRYIKYYAKENDVSVERVSGVILAQGADPELLEALKEEPNVEFKKYYFSIEMK